MSSSSVGNLLDLAVALTFFVDNVDIVVVVVVVVIVGARNVS